MIKTKRKIQKSRERKINAKMIKKLRERERERRIYFQHVVKIQMD